MVLVKIVLGGTRAVNLRSLGSLDPVEGSEDTWHSVNLGSVYAMFCQHGTSNTNITHTYSGDM